MPRQQTGKHAQRPALEGFWHEGVVRVGECFAGNIPGLIPIHLVFIQQQAHQLGDGDGRMGVIELNSKFLVKFLQRYMLHRNNAHHVLK